MSEQAVQLLQVVADPDTAVGEQALGLVSFVDAAGAPVNVTAGAVVPAPPAEAGDYSLQVTVDAEGAPVYSWAAVVTP